MINISNHINTVIQGDCLKELKTFPDSCIDCVITSPPYWQLRDYGWKEQWGLEKTYRAYLENLWSLMNEIYRVLKPQGTVWINIGDTYFGSGNGSSKTKGSKREINQYKNSEVYPTKANDDKSNGLKKKTLSLIPHRFAIGCLERGWIIRNDIIWAKPNSLPESSKDRFGKKHEHIFFMTKSPKYFFDLDAIRDPYKESSKQRAVYEVTSFKGDDVKKVPVGKSKKSGSKQSKIALNPLGKNPGDVTDFWSISNKHGSDKHYAVFNSELILKPVLAGCPKGGIILDPFCGTATTGVTAIANGRNFIGIEGNKEYVKISQRNLKNVLADNKIESLDGRMTSIEIADYLNKQADVLQKYIDAKLNPAIASQNPTARRMRIASSMREDALKMERLQTILRTLAKAHSSNNILRFPHLEDIRNKKQIQSLLQLEYLKKYNRDIDWYIDHDKDTLERMSIFSKHDWENAYKQLEDLLIEFSDGKDNNKQRETETSIRQLEQDVISRKISGFFPTPKPLVERMLEMANIESGDSVLDPSAGKGDILDVVKEQYGESVKLSAIEINSTLREILRLKGYGIVGNNFFDYQQENFDKILMNPPFENGADMDHVVHAYSVLNTGGTLVALMSEGVFFRSYKKEQNFRTWLHQVGALISEPIKDGFKNAFKSTGITVRMVTITKEGEKPLKQEKTTVTDEMELLELEALAELELLKMELESKKSNKKGLNGKQKSKPYPTEEEFLLGNVNEKTKKRKATTKEVGIKNVPEVKLTFRKNENFPTAKIVKSVDAVDFIRKLFEKDTIQLQEQFMVLYLNRSSHVLGYHLLSKGGIAGTVADLRLIFSAAILSLSSAIILAHNHPSGNLKPSDADIKLTQRIVETGRIMEIPVLDSIILTEESFYSFADDGMI